MITSPVSSTITAQVSSFSFLTPVCVAYKEFQEKVRQQILEAFTLPEKYVIIIIGE